LHPLVKFHQNPSIRYRDIAIFHFLKMAAVGRLGFVGAYLDHPQRVLGGFVTSQNLVNVCRETALIA